MSPREDSKIYLFYTETKGSGLIYLLWNIYIFCNAHNAYLENNVSELEI